MTLAEKHPHGLAELRRAVRGCVFCCGGNLVCESGGKWVTGNHAQRVDRSGLCPAACRQL